jgi:hypothetical protein
VEIGGVKLTIRARVRTLTVLATTLIEGKFPDYLDNNF